MRRLIVLLMWLSVGMTFSVHAQLFPDPFRFPEENRFDGGLGVTWIDGNTFTTLTLTPDIAAGKFGLGLYLQLLFDNENGFKLRETEYEGGAGILRAIRYIRYGQKYEPIFFRAGSIDRASLANGFLMWNYNNASNYDKRKIGLVADLDFDIVGFESFTSSFGTSNLQGGNVYVRPLKFMQNPPPVINKLRIYATYLRDDNVVETQLTDSTFTKRDLSAYSFGVDLPWLDLKLLKSFIYADYSKISNYGNGQAVGIQFIVPEFIGLFGVGARLEKRFLDAQFIPHVFGPLYELQRKLAGSQGIIGQLNSAKKAQGIFGELSGHVIHKVRLIGSFEKLNGIAHTGILHLEAYSPDLIPKFDLRAYYDKTNIETFREARTLDINSILTAEVGYELNRYLLLTMVYQWYWVQDPARPGSFKPLERVEPRLSFRYNF